LAPELQVLPCGANVTLALARRDADISFDSVRQGALLGRLQGTTIFGKRFTIELLRFERLREAKAKKTVPTATWGCRADGSEQCADTQEANP